MTGTTVPAATAPEQSGASVLVSDSNRPPASQDHSENSSRRDRSRLRDDPRIALLISTIIHTLLLILLSLFTYREGRGAIDALLASQGDVDSTVTLEQLDSKQFSPDQQTSAEQPVAVTIGMADVSPVASPVHSNHLLDDPTLDALGSASRSTNQAALVRLPGGGLSGRTPDRRAELGAKYGATRESEQAVEMALQWLARHQRPDGSWSFNLELDPCNGQCRHSKKDGSETPTPSTGATGLALLAFLGAGHTHKNEGPYQETVRAGIYYLRSIAGEAAAGYDWQKGSMYGHGIAMMALAEALAMSGEDGERDSDLFDLVSRGASFTSVAQHRNGSWGYVPGSPGDMTVSGWQVLSLITARKSQVPLHTNTLRDAKDFVKSTATEDRKYWFGYKGPPGEPTTTAIGLTLLLYLGESPAYTDFYMALTDLAQRGPKLTNIYHDYYATLALHHSRHHEWDRWNTKLRDHLVATQETEGHERGSWHFPDRWGDIGGRLYTTAMCAMTLEIYYRYLPLYESIDDFPL